MISHEYTNNLMNFTEQKLNDVENYHFIVIKSKS